MVSECCAQEPDVTRSAFLIGGALERWPQAVPYALLPMRNVFGLSHDSAKPHGSRLGHDQKLEADGEGHHAPEVVRQPR